MSVSLNLTQALRLTECAVAVSLAIQTLEFMRMGHALGPHGLWAWSLQRGDVPVPWVRAILDRVFTPWVLYGHWVLRLLAACALCVVGGSLALVVFLFIGNLLILIRWRGAFNGGSDFLTLVVLTGLLLTYAVSSAIDPVWGIQAGLWYICIQSVTSYFMSGAVKLLRAEWRSGEAMIIFLNAAIYGPLPASHWLRRRAWARWASWSFIGWECAFPLALFHPLGAGVFCGVAAVFHFLVFWFFGLNRFFWAWLASFPAILWGAAQRPFG